MERENRDLIGGMGVARLEHELVQIKTILRNLAEQSALLRSVDAVPDNTATTVPNLTGALSVVVEEPVRVDTSPLDPLNVNVTNTALPVDITNQPINVNVTNTGGMNVNVTNQPIGVTVQNAPMVQAQQAGSWTMGFPEEATFIAYYDRVVPAAGKHLATLWNGSTTHRVRIWRIVLHNFQETAVTGVAILGELRRIGSHSGGTSVIPLPFDTATSLPTGIVASHGATMVVLSDLICRWVATGEEVAVGAAILQSLLSVSGAVVYEHRPPQTPLTLRANQGVTLVQSTNTTIGSVSATIVFSVVG